MFGAGPTRSIAHLIAEVSNQCIATEMEALQDSTDITPLLRVGMCAETCFLLLAWIDIRGYCAGLSRDDRITISERFQQDVVDIFENEQLVHSLVADRLAVYSTGTQSTIVSAMLQKHLDTYLRCCVHAMHHPLSLLPGDESAIEVGDFSADIELQITATSIYKHIALPSYYIFESLLRDGTSIELSSRECQRRIKSGLKRHKKETR